MPVSGEKRLKSWAIGPAVHPTMPRGRGLGHFFVLSHRRNMDQLRPRSAHQEEGNQDPMRSHLHAQLADVMMQLRKIKRLARGLPEGQRRLLALQLQGLEAERVLLRQQLREDSATAQRRSTKEGGATLH
jgi:hypothetical protein